MDSRSTKQIDGRTRRGGYSLAELVIVVAIGAALLGMGMPHLAGLRDESGVASARDAVVALAARARAAAIERGESVTLQVKAQLETAYLIAGTDTLETVDFAADHQTDLQLVSPDSLAVCYTPRGYAQQQCRGRSLPDSVMLARGSASAIVRIGGLGQLER